MTKNRIIKLVGDALKKGTDPRLGAELLVLSDGIRKSEDWWYVPVYPVPEVRRLYDLYNSLAMAAEELDKKGVKIQLIPAHAPESVH